MAKYKLTKQGKIGIALCVTAVAALLLAIGISSANKGNGGQIITPSEDIVTPSDTTENPSTNDSENEKVPSEDINDSTSVETNNRVIPTSVELGDYYTCSEGSLENLFDGDLTTYAWLCPNLNFDLSSRCITFNFNETLNFSKIVIHSGSDESPSDTVSGGRIVFNHINGSAGTYDAFKDNTDFELNLDINSPDINSNFVKFYGLQGLDSKSWILINEIEFYKL